MVTSPPLLCPLLRLISERTVEENILKKANQKRMLGDMAIEGGNFTTAYFKQVVEDPGVWGKPRVWAVTPLDVPVGTQVARNLLQVPPWSHISRAWWWQGDTREFGRETQVSRGTQVAGQRQPGVHGSGR